MPSNVQIPMPQTIRGNVSTPKQTELIENGFYHDGYLFPRPGTRLFNAGIGVPRGGFVLGDDTYFISDQSLYLVDVGVTDQGVTIDGTGHVNVAVGFGKAILVCPDSDKTYQWDGATLTDLSANPNFVPFRDVEYEGQRMLFVPKDGSPVRFTNAQDFTTIDGASFFDAEETPDNNIGILRNGADIAVMGRDTIEFFRNTGATSAPYRRVANGSLNVGYLCGKVLTGRGFMFIGQESDGLTAVYMYEAGQTPKVSTRAVDAILQTYDTDTLLEANAFDFEVAGYRFVCFNLANHSLLYHQGNWSVSTSEGEDKWYVTHTVKNKKDNYYYALGATPEVDSESGGGTPFTYPAGMWGGFVSNEFETSDFNYFPILFKVRSFMRLQGDLPFSVSQLKVSVNDDFDNVNTPIGLAISHDGVNYSQPLLAQPSESNQMVWNPPGGLGFFEGFMGYELTVTGHRRPNTSAPLFNFAADSLMVTIDG